MMQKGQKEHTYVINKTQLATFALLILGGLGLVLVVRGSSKAEQSDVTTNAVIPLDSTGFLNACNGEVVALSGSINSKTRVAVDQNGGFHAQFHLNFQGVSGVGLTTGAKYQLSAVENSPVHEASFPSLPAESTFTMHLNVIGQGAVPNFVAQLTFHTTINANGEATAMVLLDKSTDCP